VKSATLVPPLDSVVLVVSIHALVKSATKQRNKNYLQFPSFNPRAREERDKHWF